MPIDKREIAQLEKWLLQGSKKFELASTMWLNRAVYHTRKNAVQYISTRMTARNKGFIKKSLKFEKVPRGASLAQQVAYVGSVQVGKSTGWAEQERVAPDRRTKTITLAARGKRKSRVVAKRFRTNAAGGMRSPKDYKGGNAHRRAVALLAHIERANIRDPFLLHGHHSFPGGIYRMMGRKGSPSFQSLQLFDRKPAKSRPNYWLRTSARSYLANVNTRQVWGDIVRRLVKPPTKR